MHKNYRPLTNQELDTIGRRPFLETKGREADWMFVQARHGNSLAEAAARYLKSLGSYHTPDCSVGPGNPDCSCGNQSLQNALATYRGES